MNDLSWWGPTPSYARIEKRQSWWGEWRAMRLSFRRRLKDRFCYLNDRRIIAARSGNACYGIVRNVERISP